MPINPQIPISAATPPQNTLAMFQDALQIKAMQGALADQQRERERQAGVRNALQEAGGDLQKALPAVRTIDPLLANQWQVAAQKAAQESEDRIRKMAKEDLDAAMERAKGISQEFQTLADLPDDAARQRALPFTLKRLRQRIPGIDLSMFNGPEPGTTKYDPVMAQYMARSGQTITEQAAAEKDARDRAEKAPKTLNDWFGTAAELLDGVQDNDTLQARKDLLVERGLPKGLLKMLPASVEDTDGFETLRNLGLTPEQQTARIKEAPDVLGKWLETSASAMRGIDSQAGLDQYRTDLARQHAPQALLHLLPKTFDSKAMTSFVTNHGKADTRSLSLQANDALKRGDTDEYNRLLKVIKETGQADDKPTVLPWNTPPPPGDWNKTGPDFLATIPVQHRKTVEKVANYDEDPTKVTSMRGGMRETMMNWVNQVNPEYDQSQFALRSPTRKAFTIGTQGQQVGAANTAIKHIDQLSAMVDRLGNGAFTPGNAVWNDLRTMFGSDKVTNLEGLRSALTGEIDAVLSKGAPTVAGRAEARHSMDTASSPAQLIGYAKTMIPVIGGKLEVLDTQYHQAMGARDPWTALFPDSKAILARHGFTMHAPGTLGATVPPAAQNRFFSPSTGKYYVQGTDGQMHEEGK